MAKPQRQKTPARRDDANPPASSDGGRTLRSPEWKDVRDVLLFLGGMAGVFHETVIATGERPTLLILFAAMMGLPAFFRADDRKNGDAGP